MKLSNIGKDSASTRYNMPPSKTSSARHGLHLIVLLVKGAHGSHQLSQASDKANGCSLDKLIVRTYC